MDKQAETKSLWGYGVAAVYSIFALATLGIVAFTMTQKVELVAPDYYAKELKYDQQINRQREANDLQTQVTCQVSEDGQTALLQFPLPSDAIHGTVLFYRPSDSALDQEFVIQSDKQGRQTLPISKLAKGAWRVKVTWSLDGREFYHEFAVRL
jgi:hypothetical protein